MSSFLFLFWGLFLVLSEPVAAAGREQVRLDRNDLLQYRDSQGKIRPVETARGLGAAACRDRAGDAGGDG